MSTSLTRLVLSGREATAALLGLALASWQPPGASAFEFYAGKTVDIVIPGPAGGGPDQAARAFADFLTRYTSGKPTFVIKAMPGGGGTRALNYLSGIAKPDGLTLLWGPIQFTGALVGGPGARYDPGSFAPIGTGPLLFALLANSHVGIAKPSDLLRTPHVNLGGLGQGRSIDFFSRISLDLLGVKYKYVLGYPGQPQIALALQSGEIDVSTTGYTGYTLFYKRLAVGDKPTIVPLFYHSPMDAATGTPMRAQPDMFPPDTKHFVDFARESGRDFSGPLWEAYKWIATYETWPSWLVAPKGTPEHALTPLRQGFELVIKSSEFQQAWRTRFHEEPAFVTHEKAAALQRGFRSISPAALEILKGM